MEVAHALANLIEYLIVAAFFAIEYAYRRQRFPRQPYRNMFDFVRRLLKDPTLLMEAYLARAQGQARHAHVAVE